MPALNLILSPDTFAVCRAAPDDPIPSWAASGPIYSITRTPDELSIVCLQALVPAGIRHEPGWRCLRVAGTMDFTAVGDLASLAGPLAEAGISLFAFSTFDTDYLLVKETDLEKSKAALRRAGHTIEGGRQDPNHPSAAESSTRGGRT